MPNRVLFSVPHWHGHWRCLCDLVGHEGSPKRPDHCRAHLIRAQPSHLYPQFGSPHPPSHSYVQNPRHLDEGSDADSLVVVYPRQALRLIKDPVRGVFVPLSVLSFATLLIGSTNTVAPYRLSPEVIYALFWYA
jgi:hypothetical protein